MQIAIDGPAGAGKSTVAKEVAKRLGFLYIDTGAMYRALTYKAIKNKLCLDDTDNILKLVETTVINFSRNLKEQRIFCDGEDVTEEIRQPEVSRNVSKLAQIESVRNKMVALQRELAYSSNIVMDGRDIGTVVLPDAEVKVYLTASLEERTTRRMKELQNKGFSTSYDSLYHELKERDYSDTNREISPLKPAQNAVIIDTTNLVFEDVVNSIIALIER